MASRAEDVSFIATDGDEVVRKVSRRLLWFLFALLVISFIDRVNISFAALAMNKSIGLNAAMFGLALTIFYAGYSLCEIPSNLALARFGAKIWIARIMITWGFASAATMLAVGPWSLYAYRFITGCAEAGFLPGMLLYMTYWFPRTHRARTNALFLMGIPATSAFAALLSGAILEMDGFLGLAGWRWLFLLEGLPAVLFGIWSYVYLDDGPQHARWLSESEKARLQARLARDHADETAGVAKRGILKQLGSGNIVLLSLAYFGLVTSLNANSTWVPQVVRGFGHLSFFMIGVLTAVPFIIAFAVMPFWGRSSDLRNERPWHVRVAMLLAAAGWLFVVAFADPGLRYFGLVLVAVGSFCGLITFWAFPANAGLLSPEARPAGIALINTVGIGGGSSLGPAIVGLLKDWSGSFTPGFLYVVVMLLMGVVCITAVAARARAPALAPAAEA